MKHDPLSLTSTLKVEDQTLTPSGEPARFPPAEGGLPHACEHGLDGVPPQQKPATISHDFLLVIIVIFKFGVLVRIRADEFIVNLVTTKAWIAVPVWSSKMLG